MTKEQFLAQDIVWADKYYNYAIHITDGGAIYLYQVDGDLPKKSNADVDINYTLRLDGVELDKLLENITKIKSKNVFENRQGVFMEKFLTYSDVGSVLVGTKN